MLSRRCFGRGLGAVSVAWATGASAGGRWPWPSGQRAAVSLTYDDGLNSQLDNALPQLEAHGFHATFFLTEDNMRDRLADWMALEARGHEIGDHTVNHPCELRPFNRSRFQARQLAPMEAFLDAHFQTRRPRVFAYPCGATELGDTGGLNARQQRYLTLMRRDFLAARTVDGGPNDPRLVMRYRYLLQASAPTYDQDDAKLAIDYVQWAIERGYWAILIFHDVVDQRRATGQTSRATHAAILDWIAKQPVWCAPMGTVFRAVARGKSV